MRRRISILVRGAQSSRRRVRLASTASTPSWPSPSDRSRAGRPVTRARPRRTAAARRHAARGTKIGFARAPRRATAKASNSSFSDTGASGLASSTSQRSSSSPRARTSSRNSTRSLMWRYGTAAVPSPQQYVSRPPGRLPRVQARKEGGVLAPVREERRRPHDHRLQAVGVLEQHRLAFAPGDRQHLLPVRGARLGDLPARSRRPARRDGAEVDEVARASTDCQVEHVPEADDVRPPSFVDASGRRLVGGEVDDRPDASCFPQGPRHRLELSLVADIGLHPREIGVRGDAGAALRAPRDGDHLPVAQQEREQGTADKARGAGDEEAGLGHSCGLSTENGKRRTEKGLESARPFFSLPFSDFRGLPVSRSGAGFCNTTVPNGRQAL